MKTAPLEGDLQDGMLAYYLEQAKFTDANVEARIEKEPFDFREFARPRTVGVTPGPEVHRSRFFVNRGS